MTEYRKPTSYAFKPDVKKDLRRLADYYRVPMTSMLALLITEAVRKLPAEKPASGIPEAPGTPPEATSEVPEAVYPVVGE